MGSLGSHHFTISHFTTQTTEKYSFDWLHWLSLLLCYCTQWRKAVVLQAGLSFTLVHCTQFLNFSFSPGAFTRAQALDFTITRAQEQLQLFCNLAAAFTRAPHSPRSYWAWPFLWLTTLTFAFSLCYRRSHKLQNCTNVNRDCQKWLHNCTIVKSHNCISVKSCTMTREVPQLLAEHYMQQSTALIETAAIETAAIETAAIN